ncbi:hypothetical protein AUEXF2481DRAFT_2089 [Aureobasidium subglaciale EXF-2481]|uniref:Nuclear rim protein 1 n=1 Tax=Aureobasidium subglaciale (strain EXF-2481) TaxID=1043005 RepID=A0A074YK21_AURSE|nr:uncharacterized protein AUEXF2481DRAFT_2089 [Aureobasidium subglaciale EXF-2481]KAI5200866.1 hypothetical protein E4T38_06321 [Aureobasidium subglaciale]KAI5219519.1 hypothetical protein E4T40_06427 [Aureobasidium subglaciale]KAI5223255.1 hypothetical protein E4T41_06267 [Aureobasidium subglaciale]KAI5252695.1 hypothetical protein E4T46_09849 [Aureobasidium subglaciale]KEQ98108.1 hypothetical protein AUEXF2481DRAFT_2089 [Aureobasidium subglaciale EXF-2481]
MPPIIRRPPLSERIKAKLNPYDLLLWMAEELHESALDEALRDWGLPIGAGANLIFACARWSLKNSVNDDIFGELEGKSGWFHWFLSFVAHFLAFASLFNAFYTFTRSRKYRLFESSIDQAPSTPSARRVRVDSSPSASPLAYFSSMITSNSVFSRRHPDQHNDVWEVSVWDPKPFNLELFALFSPGHVLVYWLFLPTSPADPRPSVTFVTTILLATLLSVQLLFFKKFFVQQAKDSTLIHKEVMNEYDTKFVHPNMNGPVRDVGTQTIDTATSPGGARIRTREVDVYTPHTVINKGFKVNPNPAYVNHLTDDPRALYATSPTKNLPRSATTPLLQPTFGSYSTVSSFNTNAGSSFGATHEPTDVFNTPGKTQPLTRERLASPLKRAGDGGSLGVYSHAASPLRKSANRQLLRPDGRPQGSPLKRTVNEQGGLTERFARLSDASRRDSSRY